MEAFQPYPLIEQNYKFVSVLGNGSFSGVGKYIDRHRRLVAIKVFPSFCKQKLLIG